MAMQTVQFNASEHLEDYVPDDAEVVNVRYEGDTEEVEFRIDEDEFTCDECGEQFGSSQALAGHKSVH